MKPGEIARRLVDWYGRGGRTLPWRRNRTPYRVWVSEIMLQQTRIETVIPYYRRFLKLFPTVRALAAASLDEVLKAWEGLGYYARARNLHRAAQQVVESGGRFPKSAEEWSSLPGIGKYTSAAIASLVSGERVPVIDGNVKRVVARLLLDPAPSEEVTEKFLHEAIRKVPPGPYNESIMELGQRICTPKSPACLLCPLQRGCRARGAGRQEEVPVRRKSGEIPHHEIAIGVCRKGERVLVSRRKEEGLLGGLWEFPGGKIEVGEGAEGALIREFQEEVGLEIRVGRKFAEVPFRYSHFSVRLHTFHCTAVRGRARAKESAEVRWVERGRLRELAFPKANREIIEALECEEQKRVRSTKGKRREDQVM